MDANQRRLLLEKQRLKLEADLKDNLNDIRNKAKVSIGFDKFVTKSDDKAEKLAAETVGLVRLDDFQKIKENTLASGTDRTPSAEEVALQQRQLKQRTSKLSFDLSEDEYDETEENIPTKKFKLGPDPAAIQISQALEDESIRETRKKQAEDVAKRLAIEEATKNQPIKLNCCYWDGSERRFILEGRKGDSVAELMEKAQSVFPPLKGVLSTSLVLVKENLILPNEWSIYDFMVKKAFSRSMPLFEFVEDDTGVEIDSSKNCKIVTKSWLERNRNEYPAKQWYEFNMEKHLPVKIDQ